jgi:hypothetical protein
MPQLQNLIVTDRTPTTPVNLTFTPREITADNVGVVSNNAGTPIGEKRISVSMKKRNSRFKGEVRLILPVVATETINGVSRPTVIRTAYLTLQADFDEKSTQQERDDAVGLIQSALAPSKVLVNDALVKLEGVY